MNLQMVKNIASQETKPVKNIQRILITQARPESEKSPYFEMAKKYVQEKGLELPVFYPAADLPSLFTVNGIPTTFIFNEEGQLISQREGSENYNTAEYRQLFGVAK